MSLYGVGITSQTGLARSKKVKLPLSADFPASEATAVAAILSLKEPKERAILVGRLSTMFSAPRAKVSFLSAQKAVVQKEVKPPPEPNPHKVGYNVTIAGRLSVQVSKLISQEDKKEPRDSELLKALYAVKRLTLYLGSVFKEETIPTDEEFPYTVFAVYPVDKPPPPPEVISEMAREILKMIDLEDDDDVTSDDIKEWNFNGEPVLTAAMVIACCTAYGQEMESGSLDTFKQHAVEAQNAKPAPKGLKRKEKKNTEAVKQKGRQTAKRPRVEPQEEVHLDLDEDGMVHE